MYKRILGRTDKVDFPKLGLTGVDIKIDTGAYTSSIHCYQIREVQGVLICTFHDPKHPDYDGRELHFDSYDIKAVKSSNGEVQMRYLVQTNVRIFQKIYKISLTLSSRDDMRFPVLLGRKFLTKKFIIDTELTNLSHTHQIHEHQDTIS